MRRAAVIGAGKIGRHHAKWLHHSGCDVAGFVVSSPDHIESRAAEIRPDCPSLGQGYADVERMLDEVQPELVSVCSPAELHADHAAAALSRGVAVLCEKPLVWSSDPAEAIAQANRLGQLSARHAAPLGVNLQYTFGAHYYRRLAGDIAEPTTCEVVLESRGKGAERSPDEVWMELGPHALSLAFGLLPGYGMDVSSLTVEAPPRTAIAHFRLVGPAGTVQTKVECGQRMEGDLTRRFGLDDRLVDYAGRNNSAGDYCTYLSLGEVEEEYPDLMRTSIERFVTDGVGGVNGAVDQVAGRANLEAQLVIAAAIRDSGSR